MRVGRGVVGLRWLVAATAGLAACTGVEPEPPEQLSPVAQTLISPGSGSQQTGWWPNDPLTATWPGAWQTGDVCGTGIYSSNFCATMNAAFEGFPRRTGGASFISLGGWQDGDGNYTFKKASLFNGDKAFDATFPGSGSSSTWQTAPYPMAGTAGLKASAHVYLPNSKKVLIAGGTDQAWRQLNNVYLYDPAANTWQDLSTSLPLPNKQTFFYTKTIAWTCGVDRSTGFSTGIDCALLVGGLDSGGNGNFPRFLTDGRPVGSVHTYLFISNPVTGGKEWVVLDQPSDGFDYFAKSDYKWHNTSTDPQTNQWKVGVLDGALSDLTRACRVTNEGAASEATNPLSTANIATNCVTGHSTDKTLAGNATAKPSFFPQFLYAGGRRFLPTVVHAAGVNTMLILNNWATVTPSHQGVTELPANWASNNNPTNPSWRHVTKTDTPSEVSTNWLRMPATCSNASHNGFVLHGVNGGVCDSTKPTGNWDYAEDDFEWSNLKTPRLDARGICELDANGNCPTDLLTVYGPIKSQATPTRAVPFKTSVTVPAPPAAIATNTIGSRMGLNAISARGGQVWITGGLVPIVSNNYPNAAHYGSRRSNFYVEGLSGTGTGASLAMRSPALRGYHGFGQTIELGSNQYQIFGGLNRNMTASDQSERWTYDSANTRFNFVSIDDTLDSFVVTNYNTFNNGITYTPCSNKTQCGGDAACLNAAGTAACANGSGCKCAVKHGYLYPYGAETAVSPLPPILAGVGGQPWFPFAYTVTTLRSSQILFVSVVSTNAAPTSVTYNGIAMTLGACGAQASPVDASGNRFYQSLYYMLAPPSGTYNVVVSGVSDFFAAAYDIANLAQVAPTCANTNSGNSTSATVSSTPVDTQAMYLRYVATPTEAGSLTGGNLVSGSGSAGSFRFTSGFGVGAGSGTFTLGVAKPWVTQLYKAPAATGTAMFLYAGGYDNVASMAHDTYWKSGDVAPTKSYTYRPLAGVDPRNLTGCTSTAGGAPAVCSGNADTNLLAPSCVGFTSDQPGTPAATELACTSENTALIDANAFTSGTAHFMQASAESANGLGTIAASAPIYSDPVTSAHNSTPAASLTWSHTVGAEPNRILLVTLSATTGVYGSPGNITGVTYGGTPLTKVSGGNDDFTNNARTRTYYLLAPPTGTANVVISYAGGSPTAYMTGGALSFSGVAQVAPTDLGNTIGLTSVINPGLASSRALTVVTAAANFDVEGGGLHNLVGTGTQQVYETANDYPDILLNQSTMTIMGAAPVGYWESFGAGEVHISGVLLQPAGAGTGSPYYNCSVTPADVITDPSANNCIEAAMMTASPPAYACDLNLGGSNQAWTHNCGSPITIASNTQGKLQASVNMHNYRSVVLEYTVCSPNTGVLAMLSDNLNASNNPSTYAMQVVNNRSILLGGPSFPQQSDSTNYIPSSGCSTRRLIAHPRYTGQKAFVAAPSFAADVSGNDRGFVNDPANETWYFSLNRRVTTAGGDAKGNITSATITLF